MLQNLKKECAIWEVFAIFLKVDNRVYKMQRAMCLRKLQLNKQFLFLSNFGFSL